MQKNTHEARDAALDEIKTALRAGGYFCEDKVPDESPFGDYKVRLAARHSKHQKRIAIGFQYQETKGTAEEKIAHHLVCLGHVAARGQYRKVFLVWGGENWKNSPTNAAYDLHIVNARRVTIIGMPAFCADARAGRL